MRICFFVYRYFSQYFVFIYIIIAIFCLYSLYLFVSCWDINMLRSLCLVNRSEDDWDSLDNKPLKRQSQQKSSAFLVC